eukprot:3675329-Rhodomonas_salina.3
MLAPFHAAKSSHHPIIPSDYPNVAQHQHPTFQHPTSPLDVVIVIIIIVIIIIIIIIASSSNNHHRVIISSSSHHHLLLILHILII